MAARDNVDLDRIVDYKAEYTAAISKEKLGFPGTASWAFAPSIMRATPAFLLT